MPRTHIMARDVGRVLAAVGFFGILAATLTPQSAPMPNLPTFCIVCGELGGVDVTLNVILFLPFAAGLAVAGVRTRRIVLAAFLLSLTIELLQIRTVPGRDSSLGDLTMNTIGGIVGAGLGATWRTWLTPARAVAARLQLLAGAGWLFIVALSAWSLRPSLPDARFYGQPMPQHHQFDPYTGALLDFRLNGLALRNDSVPSDPRYTDPLRTGDATVQLTVTAPREPSVRVAAIARMANPRAEAFLVGQQGRDLMVRMRLRAARLALRMPSLAVDDGFANDVRAGDTLRIEAGLAHAGRTMFARRSSTRASQSTAEYAVRLTPAMGWMLFVPFDVYIRPDTRWLGTLWLAGLALPLGFFGARVGREHIARSLIIAAAFVACALVGAPTLVGLAPVGALEWCSAAIGVLVGWIVGRRRAADAEPSSYAL